MQEIEIDEEGEDLTGYVKHGWRSSYVRGCRCFLCKQANSSYSNAHKKAARRKGKAKCIDLMSKYGITLSDYEQMISNQNGLCYICKEKPNALMVDHNHITGKVRALLCRGCNFGLGNFNDDVERMKDAILYIQKFCS